MEKLIHLDNRRQLILEKTECVYEVREGEVYLFFTKFDASGNNLRKHFVGTLAVGEVFSGHRAIDSNGAQEGFVAQGAVGTAVEICSLELAAAHKLNAYYEKMCEAFAPYLTKVHLQEVKDPVDIEVLEQNNNAVLSAAAESIFDNISREQFGQKLRQDMNDRLNQKTAEGILGLFAQRRQTNAFHAIEGKDALYDACQVICESQGINIATYEDVKKCVEGDLSVADVGRVSKFPVRSVILEENWYKTDNGPLLVYTIEDERPLALIPASPKKYMVYDVENRKAFPLTQTFAQEIIPRGDMFYRPLENKPLGLMDIFIFGIRGAWMRDIAKILALTLVGTLMGLILPVLNQKIFDDYIPEGADSQLVQIGILILCFMVGNFFISMLKAFATFRATNRMEYGLQAAIFDRLLNFPTHIYSQYNSGELATRAMGVTMIFNTIADVVVSVVLSTLFSLLYLWRMMRYNTTLSWVGLGMVAITVLITLVVGFIQLKYEKRLIEVSNKMAGVMYQFILGINKIRLSGSEDRALFRWSRDYLKSRELVLTKERIANQVRAINGIINVLFSLVIYYMLIYRNIKISFGVFAGFMSAFGSFSGAMVQMAQTFISANRLIPIYEKAKPILETVAEYQENAIVPGTLSGEIEVSHLKFRYGEQGSQVLNDVSFKIEAGEYVGIVGPSGSGKSTLLKVLLGFEITQVGNVFYDDKDIESINKRELRKKLGVVLQNGQTIAGSIYENITINNSKLSLKRVREVIDAVGFTADVEAMPMGIHTMLMEDGGTISGGQKQRVLIARAIANDPKIIYFDEATSALDNITQSIVCESLKKLEATRVVIAHRLSTIRDCDRILVMEEGRIVEQGDYETLMANKGLFYRMARRQLA